VSAPEIVSDIVDAYVFRRREGAVELLQLRRTRDPMRGTWQPVMGRIEAGERAERCALRELAEEVGLRADDGALLGFWRLERVHPYYLATRNAIVLGPRFAVEVAPSWSARPNAEHDAARWVGLGSIDESFLWSGQRASIRELAESILRPGSQLREVLRIDPGSV
jgi:8-oxo-dGTP pyrophosphatase MutT (NUDIX family)